KAHAPKISGRSSVVAAQRRRDAVKIGKESALVDADKIELVAKLAHEITGNDEFHERVTESVLLEERVERLVAIGAQGEDRRLRDDARVDRRRLEQTGERLLLSAASEKLPRGIVAAFVQQFVEVRRAHGERRKAEGVVHCLPVQPPDGAIAHGGRWPRREKQRDER